MQRAILTIGCAVLGLAAPASAEFTQLGSHEHGQGSLNIAIEGKVLELELEVPGADIVGFEHPAQSADDIAAVETAKVRMANGGALFVFPRDAACDLEHAKVKLIGEGDGHDVDHGHEHGNGHRQGHGTGSGSGSGSGSGDAETESHNDEGHTEFFAYYKFGCADPDGIDQIQFPYFDLFPNARSLQIQMISRDGTTGFTVERDNPTVQIGR